MLKYKDSDSDSDSVGATLTRGCDKPEPFVDREYFSKALKAIEAQDTSTKTFYNFIRSYVEIEKTRTANLRKLIDRSAKQCKIMQRPTAQLLEFVSIYVRNEIETSMCFIDSMEESLCGRTLDNKRRQNSLKTVRKTVDDSYGEWRKAVDLDTNTRKRMWKLERIISKELMLLKSLKSENTADYISRRVHVDRLSSEMLVLMKAHGMSIPLIEQCRQEMMSECQEAFDEVIDEAEGELTGLVRVIEHFGGLKNEQYHKCSMGALALTRTSEMKFVSFTSVVNSYSPAQYIHTDLMLYHIPAEDGNLLMPPERRRKFIRLWLCELDEMACESKGEGNDIVTAPAAHRNFGVCINDDYFSLIYKATALKLEGVFNSFFAGQRSAPQPQHLRFDDHNWSFYVKTNAGVPVSFLRRIQPSPSLFTYRIKLARYRARRILSNRKKLVWSDSTS